MDRPFGIGHEALDRGRTNPALDARILEIEDTSLRNLWRQDRRLFERDRRSKADETRTATPTPARAAMMKTIAAGRSTLRQKAFQDRFRIIACLRKRGNWP